MTTTLYLISDFNIEILGRYLANAPGKGIELEVESAAFGQVYQSLSRPPPVATSSAVVWTRPEALFESYGRALQMSRVVSEDVLVEVDDFTTQLVHYAGQVRALFVPTWVLPVGHRGYGMLDHRPDIGLSHLLAQMNLRLAERLAVCPNAFVLDTEHWLRIAGPKAGAPKMWYTSKVPFGNQVFQEAAMDLVAALQGLAGLSRRLVVLDLDDTLWGGIVGETGWAGLALGGHDHVGEAYVDFQRALRALSARGVQLGIVSKNDEATALEAIDRHPEMLLRRPDFAGWRINWGDKAANLVELVDELNLGLASVVFIDDTPAERARISEALPEVLVPDWPTDPALYVSALMGLRCFDTPSIEVEDRQRTAMYAVERERRASLVGQAGAGGEGSVDDWLRSLDLQVTAGPLVDDNLARAAQLFNKTNQMNLATRRLSEGELRAWAARPKCSLWTFSVADRFGASGLTGIVSVQVEGGQADIVDFILSCRVMGRKIEETMLHVAVAQARRLGATLVQARYLPTPRNGPCLAFWDQRSGFTRSDELGSTRFVWDAGLDYPAPGVVTLLAASAAPI